MERLLLSMGQYGRTVHMNLITYQESGFSHILYASSLSSLVSIKLASFALNVTDSGHKLISAEPYPFPT